MGGAGKIFNLLGFSLILIACMLWVGPGIGIGSDSVGVDSYEVGSATAAPEIGKIGDTIHLQGTGILKDEEVAVLFGVRIDNVNYITDVGTTYSDSAGNWSFDAPIPSTVYAYNITAAAAAAVKATTGDSKPFWSFSTQGGTAAAGGGTAAAGITDGTPYSVSAGFYHYAGVTLGDDGALYGTNTNWVEVTDDATGDTESSPSSTAGASSSDLNSAQLPETGIPAAIIGLSGAGLLAAGFYLRRQPRCQEK